MSDQPAPDTVIIYLGGGTPTSPSGGQLFTLPDAKLRVLLLAFRRAALLIADAIGEYCGLPPRG